MNKVPAIRFSLARRGWMVTSLAVAPFVACNSQGSKVKDEDFQRDFGIEKRTFLTTGRNPYFVLEPGYQLVLADGDDKLTITVLNETHQVGNVLTRVVEERELEDGRLKEVSRNFFAICKETNDVFYFGEEVDVYKDGKIRDHPGVWSAGVNGARAGLVVPGSPRVGAKYYQEIAPGVAMDRAEIVDLGSTLETPAGVFKKCLRTHESTGLDKQESEFKVYAEGIGLIKDEDLLLVSHGLAAGR
ncbi:MAG: hypothetical protein ABI885_30645 [Gammaproteobacteria bacterium]